MGDSIYVGHVGVQGGTLRFVIGMMPGPMLPYPQLCCLLGAAECTVLCRGTFVEVSGSASLSGLDATSHAALARETSTLCDGVIT